jgi:hypothetical protein
MKPMRRSKVNVFACKPPNARSGRFAKAPLELGAGGRLDLVEFDTGLDQRLAVELIFGWPRIVLTTERDFFKPRASF